MMNRTVFHQGGERIITVLINSCIICYSIFFRVFHSRIIDDRHDTCGKLKVLMIDVR
jgi:hypothetical protein